MTTRNTPLERLRHHVTGAIERGEAEAIVSVEPAWAEAEHKSDTDCPTCADATSTTTPERGQQGEVLGRGFEQEATKHNELLGLPAPNQPQEHTAHGRYDDLVRVATLLLKRFDVATDDGLTSWPGAAMHEDLRAALKLAGE